MSDEDWKGEHLIRGQRPVSRLGEGATLTGLKGRVGKAMRTKDKDAAEGFEARAPRFAGPTKLRIGRGT